MTTIPYHLFHIIKCKSLYSVAIHTPGRINLNEIGNSERSQNCSLNLELNYIIQISNKNGK